MKSFRQGDTLIEVMLAIGIFSMVAIAIVAVMSGGISASQTALETTLAREEIDTQAEAIRFIQSSYLAEQETSTNGNTKYEALWGQIESLAINVSTLNAEQQATFTAATSATSATCSNLYDNEYVQNNAFIINPQDFSIQTFKDNSDIFTQTTTYPRTLTSNPTLLDSSTNFAAEGIYIIAATDSDTTIIDTTAAAAYYDFYIRTCWYGTGEEVPTTISTVVRTYNQPESATSSSPLSSTGYSGNKNYIDKNDIDITFLDDSYCDPDRYCTKSGTMATQTIQYTNSAARFNLNKNEFSRSNWFYFIGWTRQAGDTNPDNILADQAQLSFKETNKDVELHAVWGEYQIHYHATADENSEVVCTQQVESLAENNIAGCDSIVNPKTAEYLFQGWSKDVKGRRPLYDKAGGARGVNNKIYVNAEDHTIDLYPIWRMEIKFNSKDWIPYGTDTAERGCTVFNIEKPSAQEVFSFSKTSAGKTYGNGADIVPMDGYLVVGGKHIEAVDNVPGFGSVVNLQGYCYTKGSVGVRYQLNKNDILELSASLNTKNMLAHPNGEVSIGLGPINVKLTSTTATATCNGGQEKSTSLKNIIIGVEMFKYDNEYSISIDGSELISCTVDTNTDIYLSYSMHHNSHNCSRIFNAQLTNISMKRVQNDG